MGREAGPGGDWRGGTREKPLSRGFPQLHEILANQCQVWGNGLSAKSQAGRGRLVVTFSRWIPQCCHPLLGTLKPNYQQVSKELYGKGFSAFPLPFLKDIPSVNIKEIPEMSWFGTCRAKLMQQVQTGCRSLSPPQVCPQLIPWKRAGSSVHSQNCIFFPARNLGWNSFSLNHGLDLLEYNTENSLRSHLGYPICLIFH